MICRVESSPSTSSTLTGMFGKTISSSSTSPAPATTASASSSPVLPLSSFAPISTSNPNHATAICCFSPLGSLLAGGVSDTAAIRASAAAKYPARKISSVSSRWRAGHVNVYRTCSHPRSAGPAVTCLELGHEFRYFRCPASDSSRDWLSSTRHVAGRVSYLEDVQENARDDVAYPSPAVTIGASVVGPVPVGGIGTGLRAGHDNGTLDPGAPRFFLHSHKEIMGGCASKPTTTEGQAPEAPPAKGSAPTDATVTATAEVVAESNGTTGESEEETSSKVKPEEAEPAVEVGEHNAEEKEEKSAEEVATATAQQP
ncbi:hypothetical protein B296_00038066 [Ensete ventricosum]|uniref:Uncharacterized protein n=1 Tax=Ensete ventricosum TaxID=4639 RepID=A0A426YCL9_ENSVE|nr:hypothetical protein B296_00038066 [Ensete ventricosum]